MLSPVTAINQQIRELAPLLNSPAIRDLVTVKSEVGFKEQQQR